MGTDYSPASSTAPVAAVGAKNAAVRAVAQHHRAVVGFLAGFFLVMLLYTTLSSQMGSTSVVAVLQSTSAGRTDQTIMTSPTAPNNLAPGNDKYTSTKKEEHDEQRQKKSAPDMKKKEEQITQHGAHGGIKKKNQTDQAVSDKMVVEEEEELIRREIDQGATRKKDTSGVQQAATPPRKRKPICDLSDPRFDICEIIGDARTMGANRTVLYVPPLGGLDDSSQEWSIRDQSRKHLEYVNNVTVRALSASQSQAAPACTSRHAVPAVVFAMNGLTSNPWHDFSDVLIPLFITTRALEGEVQFLVSDLQPWFVSKYRLVLRNLSRYDVVDFNRDAGVRCYPHVTVGLRSHRDLGIDPARAPRNYTLLNFRLYIREIYSLPPGGVDIPYKQQQQKQPPPRPRVMLVNRGRTRKFVNFPEIVAAVQSAGFEVVPVEPRRDLSVEELSRAVDSCDVLMGAHGAGLTNFFFLRTNAVMLQVVPWGHMEQSAMRFYGRPAREMRLRDVEYSVAAAESTLYDKYGKDDPVVSDPDSIHRKGWQFGMRYYWIEQDIRLNVTRFAPTLQMVLKMLRD